MKIIMVLLTMARLLIFAIYALTKDTIIAIIDIGKDIEEELGGEMTGDKSMRDLINEYKQSNTKGAKK